MSGRMPNTPARSAATWWIPSMSTPQSVRYERYSRIAVARTIDAVGGGAQGACEVDGGGERDDPRGGFPGAKLQEVEADLGAGNGLLPRHAQSRPVRVPHASPAVQAVSRARSRGMARRKRVPSPRRNCARPCRTSRTSGMAGTQRGRARRLAAYCCVAP